jgi:hypothetical protein
MRIHHPLLAAVDGPCDDPCDELDDELDDELGDEPGDWPAAEGDDVAVAAPGSLAPVLVVPVFREQAENKNALAAKSSSMAEVILFSISVSHLILFLHLLGFLATWRGETAVIHYRGIDAGRCRGADSDYAVTSV